MAVEEKDERGRPFVGIMFECCNVYVRLYKNKKGDHYAGHCSHCLRPLRLPIGEGGSDNRFFRAT